MEVNKNQKQKQLIISGIVGIIIIGISLALWLTPFGDHTLDGQILLWIQDYVRVPFLNPIVIFITHCGNAGILWIVLSIILIFPKKTRKAGIISGVALLLMLIINNMIIKNAVGRIRPYEVVSGLQLIIEKQKDASFPSGHSASSIAAGWSMFRHLPKQAGIPLLVFAVLICLSRLYVGVHYPTDVLFGVLVGILVSILGEFIVTKVEALIQKKKDQSE